MLRGKEASRLRFSALPPLEPATPLSSRAPKSSYNYLPRTREIEEDFGSFGPVGRPSGTLISNEDENWGPPQTELGPIWSVNGSTVEFRDVDKSRNLTRYTLSNGIEVLDRRSIKHRNSAPSRAKEELSIANTIADGGNTERRIPGLYSPRAGKPATPRYHYSISCGGENVATDRNKTCWGSAVNLSKSWPDQEAFRDEGFAEDYDDEHTVLDPISGRLLETNSPLRRPAMVRQHVTSSGSRRSTAGGVGLSRDEQQQQLESVRYAVADDTVLESYRGDMEEYNNNNTNKAGSPEVRDEMNQSLRSIRHSATRKQLDKLFVLAGGQEPATNQQQSPSDNRSIYDTSEARNRIGNRPTPLPRIDGANSGSPLVSSVPAGYMQAGSVPVGSVPKVTQGLYTAAGSNGYAASALTTAPDSSISYDDRPIRGVKQSDVEQYYGNGALRRTDEAELKKNPSNSRDNRAIDTRISRAMRDENGMGSPRDSEDVRLPRPHPLERINSNSSTRLRLEQEELKQRQLQQSISYDGELVNSNYENGRAVNSSPLIRRKSQRPGTDASSTASHSADIERRTEPRLLSLAPQKQDLEGAAEGPGEGEELKPLKDPNKKIQEALDQLSGSSENWEKQRESLTTIRRLSLFHPEVICCRLTETVRAVVQQVNNLRSQVTRLAMVCLGDLYKSLNTRMDTEVESTVLVLLNKTADANRFIQQDAEDALESMALNVTPLRAVNSLVNCGSKHKNSAVRTQTALLLERVVQRLGGSYVLDGSRDLVDKIVSTTAQFLLDGAADTRYNGQKLMLILMEHRDFDRILRKSVSESTLRNIEDKLISLRTKGLGEPPVSSSRSRRSLSEGRHSGISRSGQSVASRGSIYRGSRSNTSAGSAASSYQSRLSNTSAKQQQLSKPIGSSGDQAAILNIESLLVAADWQSKYQGVGELRDLALSNPDSLIYSNKLLVKFIPLLRDANCKVNLASLQVLYEILPAIATGVSGMLNLLVETVAANLASKNREISDTAAAVLDYFPQHVDVSLLLQPYTSEAQKGKQQVKSDMTHRVANLVALYSQNRSNQVITHVLPFLWQTLSTGLSGGNNASLRAATSRLTAALYSLLGEELLAAASNNSAVTADMTQLLNQLLESAFRHQQLQQDNAQQYYYR